MTTPGRYVASTKDDESQQTFVFDGTMTLDDVFAHIAERTRGGSFGTMARRLKGGHKVFNLSISRDESTEPTFNQRFRELSGSETANG
jgi:hypothetical protein